MKRIFHNKLKQLSCLDRKHNKIYFTNNARTSLRVLLSSVSDKKLNVGVQAYTCHTVFQAIKKAGHKIVFLDIDENFLLDKNNLKKKIDQIDILIVTHTFGLLTSMDTIKEIVPNKIVIEDCAHSFMSRYKGKDVGKIGDAAIFSTGLGKFPAIGSGGFCIINDNSKFLNFDKKYNELPEAKIVNSIKDYLKTVLFSFLMKPPLYGMFTYRLGKKLDKKYDFGAKYKFIESNGYLWSQVILKNNCTFINKMLNKHKENAKILTVLLPDNLIYKHIDNNVIPNYYIFPLLINNRDKLYNKLLQNNIEAGKHFFKSLLWAAEFGYKKGDCPNTESIIERIIVVPVHFGVKKSDLYKIALIINKYAE